MSTQNESKAAEKKQKVGDDSDLDSEVIEQREKVLQENSPTKKRNRMMTAIQESSNRASERFVMFQETPRELVAVAKQHANAAKHHAKQCGKNRIATFAGDLFRRDDLYILACDDALGTVPGAA